MTGDRIGTPFSNVDAVDVQSFIVDGWPARMFVVSIEDVVVVDDDEDEEIFKYNFPAGRKDVVVEGTTLIPENVATPRLTSKATEAGTFWSCSGEDEDAEDIFGSVGV